MHEEASFSDHWPDGHAQQPPYVSPPVEYLPAAQVRQPSHDNDSFRSGHDAQALATDGGRMILRVRVRLPVMWLHQPQPPQSDTQHDLVSVGQSGTAGGVAATSRRIGPGCSNAILPACGPTGGSLWLLSL